MKNLASCASLIVVFLAFNSAHSQLTELPTKIFLLDDVRIGITTLDEIQNKYGTTTIIRNSNDQSDLSICYVHFSLKQRIFAIFETGPMGGFTRVTGFQLTTQDPHLNCAHTVVDLSSIKSGNNIQIGQARGEFLEQFNVPFKSQGSALIYENESKREATKDELEDLRKTWPNEEQTSFDVLISIKAKFLHNKLVYYSVTKIESY